MVACVIAGGTVAYRNFKNRAVEAERNADFARIQKDYLERVGWIRANPDAASYRSELPAFFRRYFDDVAEHHERYQGNTRFDGYLEELASKSAEASADAKADTRKAFYEYSRKVFDQIHEGRYAPTWSASDQGLRLDVVSTEVVTVLNRPQIRMSLVLWGAQREMKSDGRLKRMITSASFNTSWKLMDEKGKLLGEMSGQDPSMKVDFPERFVAEFPPQMVLGHYDLDLFPAEVTKVETTFSVSSRASSGGQSNAQFVWKLDVPENWKLKKGEKWEGAVESERPEDEINPQAGR